MNKLANTLGLPDPLNIELDTFYELSTDSYRVVEVGDTSPILTNRSRPLKTEEEAKVLMAFWRENLAAGIHPDFHIYK